jgi:hypothetical protein
VNWPVPHWTTVTEEGHNQSSPGIWSVIQEIVDRPGWTSGNDDVIIIDNRSGMGRRQAHTYDGSTAGAAKVSIDYTATPSQIVSRSVSASSDDAEQDVARVLCTCPVEAAIGGGQGPVNEAVHATRVAHDLRYCGPSTCT